MFHSLSYTVVFAETGRALTADVEFGKGMTAIAGPNESGKSVMLEMIRFLLFGSAALRGTSDSYAKLDAEGSFSVRGETYKVTRTLKKASLFRMVDGDPELIVSSTSAVNEKIVGIFGFGLPVFDIACAANQNSLRKLTEMRPTERKRMVDTVIGVGMLEAVARWAKEEANLHNKLVDKIEPTLVAPEKPQEPENFRPTSVVRTELQAAHAASREVSSLEGMLAVQPKLPQKPSCSVPMPASVLKPMADKRAAARADLAMQKATLAKMPLEARYTTTELKEMESANVDYEYWLAAQKWLAANPLPTDTLQQVQDEIDRWHRIKEFTAAQTHLTVLQKSLEETTIHCPNCDHEWHRDSDYAQGKKAQIEETLETLERLRAHGLDEPSRPASVLLPLRAKIQSFDHAKHAEMLAVQPVEKPALSPPEIRVALINNQLFEKRAGVQQRITLLENELKGPDIEHQYEVRARYERDLEHFEQQMKAHMDDMKRRQEATLRLQVLQPVALTVPLLDKELHEATIYESKMATYELLKGGYDKSYAEVQELKRLVEQYRKIAAAMNTLRTRIKQYLLPSLNRVASNLLSRMTAGSRNTIVVDDEFEITVDGQKVEGLSGSGLDCTNLALRVALGQVLVSSVFSVFLADEIDGAMDSVRAKETSVTLRNLAKVVSQIVVVSHKSIEADQHIVLGETNGTTEQSGASAHP